MSDPKLIQASDQECSEKKCKEKAVAFLPMVDPDIKAYPYCQKHLDKARLSLMIKLNKIFNQ